MGWVILYLYLAFYILQSLSDSHTPKSVSCLTIVSSNVLLIYLVQRKRGWTKINLQHVILHHIMKTNCENPLKKTDRKLGFEASCSISPNHGSLNCNKYFLQSNLRKNPTFYLPEAIGGSLNQCSIFITSSTLLGLH